MGILQEMSEFSFPSSNKTSGVTSSAQDTVAALMPQASYDGLPVRTVVHLIQYCLLWLEVALQGF